MVNAPFILLRGRRHSAIFAKLSTGALCAEGGLAGMISTSSTLEISSEPMAVQSAESTDLEMRKPWSTPRVIVSVAQSAEAHVTNNPPDGSSTIVGPYGS